MVSLILLLFKRLSSPEFIISFNISLKLFVLQYIFGSPFQVYGIVWKGQKKIMETTTYGVYTTCKLFYI